MAAPSQMLLVPHASLNEDWKAMMEMGQIDPRYWYSYEIGIAWPTLRHYVLLGCSTDSEVIATPYVQKSRESL